MRNSKDIDINLSIGSGQVFLWEYHDNSWYGIHGKNIFQIKLNKDNTQDIHKDQKWDEKIEYLSYPRWEHWEKYFFRLDDNFDGIKKSLSHDQKISKLLEQISGLRILRQEPFQCIISFLCASNTNIPRIRRMLYNLTKKFGEKIELGNKRFYLFPEPKDIANASIMELIDCGLGYRAKYVKTISSNISNGEVDLTYIQNLEYLKARIELIKNTGIGNKTADCILLFSFNKTNSFPIDVWIFRALEKYYSWLIYENNINNNKEKKDSKKYKLNPKKYDIILNKLENYFGEYAGYAQQYLYYYIRESAGKKW